MKKPKINCTPYGAFHVITHHNFILEPMQAKEAYEEMTDALIKARRCYQGVGDFETCGEMMSQIIPEIDNALKKAGCTE